MSQAKLTEVMVPVVYLDEEKWLLLNNISNSGTVRAVKIIKSKKQVLESDGHHCDQASLQSSIRYKPKKWVIA
ncbi:MAG: hypothetical protein ABIA93_04915 [Candidatus Woesearchaeota archaeon]